MSPEITSADDLYPKNLLSALIAFKKGEFSARLPANLVGMGGKIAGAFNDIAETAGRISEEMQRVSGLVGKEGKTSERASAGNARGGWQSLIASGNSLINDLVLPANEIIRVIRGVASGDLSQEVPLEAEGRKLQGQFLNSAKVVNAMVDQLRSFASEVTRVAREVGAEGKLGGQAEVKGAGGAWKDLTESVNFMAANLTSQVRNVAEAAMRAKAEEALKESEATLRAIINASPENYMAFWDASSDLKVASFSPSPELAAKAKGVVKTRKTLRYEDKEDETWFDYNFNPAFSVTGVLYGVVLFARDVTALKEAERERLLVQKMDTLGSLAGASPTTSTTCSFPSST